MLAAAYAYSCLAAFLILLPVSVATFKHLYEGSKSFFGYLLVTFTFVDALNRLGYFFVYCFSF